MDASRHSVVIVKLSISYFLIAIYIVILGHFYNFINKYAKKITYFYPTKLKIYDRTDAIIYSHFSTKLKVSKYQNEFIKSLFLPKYEPNIVRISALYCATTQGRNPYNFWFIFWEKR